MNSRLLGDLEARIAKTRDPVRNACLRAERATVLARQGSIDQARKELDLIRSRHAAAPDAVITAWVCLGEGMVVLYSEPSPQCRDKFLRAHALASACRDRRVRCLSAAWLAHLCYVDQNLPGMLEKVEQVLSEAPQDDDLTIERVCLVVAQAFHWCNRFDLARAWYDRARWHAINIGDEAFLSALMHNMAWLHVAQERRRALQSEYVPISTHQLLLSADVTRNFDQLIGIASLGSLVPMLRAHALSLLDRHHDALEQFQSHIASALAQGISRIECSVLAELAWCQVRCGRSVEALSTAEDARRKLAECKQSDELAATHGRLAQCFRALSSAPEVAFHAEQSNFEWAKHSELQQSALSALLNSQRVSAFLTSEARHIG